MAVASDTVPAGGELAETPDLYGAFPRLNEQQLAVLMGKGTRRRVGEGEVLYRRGDVNCDFHVILEGLVEIVDEDAGDNHVIGVHGPRRFLGELSVLTGEASFVTAVVRVPGEILVVPVDRLRELVAGDPTLGDLILRAYLVRRSVLIDLGVGFRIIGSRYSPDTRRLREFAARNRLPHRWIDLEDDGEAERLLQELGITPDETPVVIVRCEVVLRNPSNADLARALGLRPADMPLTAVLDLVVVGAGPAGLAAAVYAASEGLTTAVLEGVSAGGQAGTSSRIENYLGFPAGISGAELAERAEIQARKFGAQLSVPVHATALDDGENHHVVHLEDGSSIAARTVLVATGARYRRLDVPLLDEFEGTSVYYAATEMEAQMCVGDPVAIVGGGNSAGQAAVFLARRAARVRLIIRGDDLAQDMSRYLAERIERLPNVDVCLNAEVRELLGEHGRLEAVVVQDTRTGDRKWIETRVLFVFIGAEPHARWLGDSVCLDKDGFVLTGGDAVRAMRNRRRQSEDFTPLVLETTRPGVFAAGDVRRGSVKRVAAAVGEGAMAVRLIHDHLGVARQIRT
jgi:thioredoxin reductase (NADPH)